MGKEINPIQVNTALKRQQFDKDLKQTCLMQGCKAVLSGAINSFNAKIVTMLAFFKTLFSPQIVNSALAWQQAGNAAGNAYWLFAAPVHLVLQRDSFSLAEPAPMLMDAAEADALTTALNKHFAADIVNNKVMFFWHKNTWFLRLETNPNISTFAPQTVVNRNVSSFMPAGEGAIQWASFTNEIQMLLFEHPINQAREAKRLPMINSIWCYGGGQMNQAS